MDSITQDVSWKRKLRRIYDFNLSSTMRSDGGFVTFRAVCWGNCSRMLWTEHPVCHVCCNWQTEYTNNSNVCENRLAASSGLFVRLSVRKKYLGDKGRNFVKWNIYMKTFRKSVLNSVVTKLWKEKQYFTFKRAVRTIMVVCDWIVIGINCVLD